MAPKFGTSGLRGLVVDLTPECVASYVQAFIAACPIGNGLYVGHDLRPSSPDLAQSVAAAAESAGVRVVFCGGVPTPALALAADKAGAAAIMVTGSHIPADRNGLKFYTPAGEITKADEQAINAAVGTTSASAVSGEIEHDDTIAAAYLTRYVDAFGTALAGLRVGLYSHSGVARDVLKQILQGLGADVVELGRTDDFIPVDTEAVSAELRAQLRDWAKEHGVAAIVSTDPDGDRPLLTDANGNVIPGDVLGQITAKMLGAEIVVTPVSSNTGVDKSGDFAKVIRTQIGSPFVIAAMEQAGGKVIGYEANGGFLLGYDATGPAGGVLTPLVTRDSTLPMVCVLASARESTVAEVVAAQPARFTAADRLQEIPTEQSKALVASLTNDDAARDAFLSNFGARSVGVDTTDGLRMTLESGLIVHLRPSGNAPELRLYVEADDAALARQMLEDGLKIVAREVAKVTV